MSFSLAKSLMNLSLVIFYNYCHPFYDRTNRFNLKEIVRNSVAAQ